MMLFRYGRRPWPSGSRSLLAISSWKTISASSLAFDSLIFSPAMVVMYQPVCFLNHTFGFRAIAALLHSYGCPDLFCARQGGMHRILEKALMPERHPNCTRGGEICGAAEWDFQRSSRPTHLL